MGRKNRAVSSNKTKPQSSGNGNKAEGIDLGKPDLRSGAKLGKKIKKKAVRAPDVHIEFGSLLREDDYGEFAEIDMDMQEKLAADLVDSDEEEADELGRIEKAHLESNLKTIHKASLEEIRQSNKLPVKDQQGKLILAKDLSKGMKQEYTDEKNQFSDEVDSGTEDPSPEEENKPKEPGLPPVKSPEYLKLRLEQLANFAQTIIADPEANKCTRCVLNDSFSYRIRSLTEEEKAVRVTKEIRNLRMYEEYLLHPRIRHAMNSWFLKHGFNFSEQVFLFVARRLATTHQDSVYEGCVDATARLFKEDELGQSSLRMIQALTRSIKHKEYRVAPATIRLFTHLKFNIDVLRSSSKDGANNEKKAGDKRSHSKMTLDLVLPSEKRQHISKRMKKRAKANKVIEQELREAEAEYSVEERNKVQSELLKNIFVIYFRILKHATSTSLFPVTLEGLSKFGNLISVDFFSDMLRLLKNVLRNGLVSNQASSEEDEPIVHSSNDVVRCQLLSILTAFKLLSGQGELLNLDLKDFYMFLYSLLPVAAQMNSCLSEEAVPVRPGDFAAPSISLLVVDCIDALFFRNRRDRVPLVRAAAFFKRIVSIAYLFPPATTVRLLTVAKAFVIKYPGVMKLFSTEDTAGDGEYAGFATDPDMVNPFATSLYELPGLLHHHYSPAVRRAAKSLLKLTSTRN
ncbi:hypothetical protein L0F63_005700 [Massospora cicadina]|nr:hypothetical protein L0F63_005700 [Massospora cicadina]